MKRIYLAIIILLFGTLACGITLGRTPVTVSTATSAPTNTQVLLRTPTVPPGGTPSPTTATITGTTTAGTQEHTTSITPQPTTEEPTATPYPTSVLDPSLKNEINLIQTQVVEERGLQPKHDVPTVLLSTDQLRTNVVNDFLADYTDEKVSDDMLELSTTGLLDPSFDFKTFYTNFLTEQIAGYYDNETGEMFVVQGQGFQGEERFTYSHEYTHALQDQTYGLSKGLNMNDDACEGDSDRCNAVQALVEGDATISQFIWENYYATKQDKAQIDAFYNSFKQPVYDSAPDFLKEDFLFPYNQGAAFVEDIFTKGGGWAAVDNVYKNPPASTEQILHPELYPSDTPIPVDLPDIASTLGEGWREVSHDKMGEWDIYLILAKGANANARLDDNTAKTAAAGWGGDEYALLHNDSTGQTAFVLKNVWDTTKDADEFAGAFEKYATTRFGVSPTKQGGTTTWTYADGMTSLYQSGDTTLWITAPDAATAQTITGVVQP